MGSCKDCNYCDENFAQLVEKLDAIVKLLEKEYKEEAASIKGKNNEFNLYQDVPAAQVIFDSGVPFVMFPCAMVTDHLLTTEPELKERCKNSGAIGNYLYTYTVEEMIRCKNDSRVIWDIVTVAYFCCPEAISSFIRPAAKLLDDASYDTSDSARHEMRYAYGLNRDIIFKDLFGRIANFR